MPLSGFAISPASQQIAGAWPQITRNLALTKLSDGTATNPSGRFFTLKTIGNAAGFLCSGKAPMFAGLAMEVDRGRCV